MTADTQRTKDAMLSALHEVQVKLIGQRDEIGAAIIRKTCEQIIELRRSLRREENARKVLADENLRLMAKWKSIFEKGAILP